MVASSFRILGLVSGSLLSDYDDVSGSDGEPWDVESLVVSVEASVDK